MQIIKEKLSNGNEVTYKIINGTAYHIETPIEVINILENAMKNRIRIRVFYGDNKTGKDWLEENDTIGYVGRSTGRIKIPLLIRTNRSFGGGSILDDCIVRITQDKRVLYQHENYHLGNLIIEEIKDDNLRKKGYIKSVLRDNVIHGNFKSLDKAEKYKSFLYGLRNVNSY